MLSLVFFFTANYHQLDDPLRHWRKDKSEAAL
jgi:hypothetical protein